MKRAFVASSVTRTTVRRDTLSPIARWDIAQAGCAAVPVGACHGVMVTTVTVSCRSGVELLDAIATP